MFTNKSCPELESACRGIWFSRNEPLTPASFLPSPLHSGGTGSGQELLHTRLFYFSKTASGPEKNSNGPVRARPLPSPRKSHGAVALSTPLHSAPPLATRREKREREAPGQTVGRPRGRAGARYACAGDPPGQDARPPGTLLPAASRTQAEGGMAPFIPSSSYKQGMQNYHRQKQQGVKMKPFLYYEPLTEVICTQVDGRAGGPRRIKGLKKHRDTLNTADPQGRRSVGPGNPPTGQDDCKDTS